MRLRLDEYSDTSDQLISLRPEILNILFGKMIGPSQMTVLHGSEKAPLTLLAHAIFVGGIHQNGRAVFLDSSSNYSPSLVRALIPSDEHLARVLSHNLVTTVMSVEDLVLATESLYEVGALTIVVIDSLTQILNMSSGPMTAGRQRRLFNALEALRSLVNQRKCHVLLTDHSSRSWDHRVPRPIGGNVLEHAVDSFVRVDRLENEPELIRVLVERSPGASPNEAVIVRYNERGLTTL